MPTMSKGLGGGGTRNRKEKERREKVILDTRSASTTGLAYDCPVLHAFSTLELIKVYCNHSISYLTNDMEQSLTEVIILGLCQSGDIL